MVWLLQVRLRLRAELIVLILYYRPNITVAVLCRRSISIPWRRALGVRVAVVCRVVYRVCFRFAPRLVACAAKVVVVVGTNGFF